ncbi:hypothetical protein ACFLTD_01170 [Elusimicrobiota bacterium]
MSSEEIKKELRQKIRLLGRGILPPEGKKYSLTNLGVGAGPQGKKYYLYTKDGKELGMISVPLFPPDHHLAKYAIKTRRGDIPNTMITEDGVVLKGTGMPKLINLILDDGTSNVNGGFAQMHCYNTCSMVLGFKCEHFDNDEECQYCEVEPIGRQHRSFPDKQVPEYMAEALKLAIETTSVRAVTITSGTFDEPDEVARHYIKTLKEMRKITDKPIHIQIEPLKDTNLLKELSLYANNIGIFLEVFNEDIRRRICPGKAKISKDKYIENWELAVEYFGRGNVLTTCILGFGENFNDVIDGIREFAGIGVKTAILFVRAKSDKMKDFTPSFLEIGTDELVDLHLNAADILTKNGICFKQNDEAGCLGCQGCTAMVEACDYVENFTD